jgi:hypothetical protein
MLTKKVNMYVGYIGILRTIHDCKWIAVIESSRLSVNIRSLSLIMICLKYRS